MSYTSVTSYDILQQPKINQDVTPLSSISNNNTSKVANMLGKMQNNKNNTLQS